MPVRKKLSVYEDLVIDQLRKRLAQEFRQPQETEPEPVLLEETGLTGGRRLYVVWSKWGDLDQRIRSKVIFDAFQDARGAREALEVTFAMGVTPEEARRMGLKYA